MRYAFALAAALLTLPAAPAADPPVTFQTHPFERVLNDLRFAADLVGGEKAVKAFNASIKDRLGDKGFDGLDLSKPVVGYVILAPNLEETVAVIAFPVTNEKDFVALCDRWNGGEKAKELGKGLWEVPGLVPEWKGRMRFASGYAYVAGGTNPEPALDPKALVAPDKLYDPAENAVLAGRLHFDRLTPEFKRSLPGHVEALKKRIGLGEGGGIDGDVAKVFKAALPDLEKMFARYALLLLGGADTATLHLGVDVPTSDLVVEFALKPKPDTPLAKLISERKPTGNKFGGLVTPDTAAGFATRLPFFNDELKSAAVKALEEGQKEANNAGADAPKDLLGELFKGLIRTVKTGEVDAAGGVRGPDKNGDFTGVVAVAFEDPSGLEKEFRKLVEKEAPPDEADRFKWDAAKADKVSIHTYTPAPGNFLDPSKIFGGAKCTVAFAFAPKGVFVVLGPDAVAVMKDILAVQPAEAPVLDVVLNPARMGKLVEKGGGNLLDVEKGLGKEDKLVSALSLKVAGGKELRVRLAVNLRMLPRAVAAEEETATPGAPEPPKK